MDRYLSQRLYKNIGKQGQVKLKKAEVAIIGIGALGTICAELLVRAGIGKLVLIDRDLIELSNLQRQFLFDERDLGRQKAEVAKEKLIKINSEVKIAAKNEDINFKTVNFVGKPDIIVAATDNMESRFLLNDYCLKSKITLIYGGAVEDKGSIFTIIPNGPCLRCIFPGATGETCDNSGILNACSAIIGSMMAAEVIKVIVKGDIKKYTLYFNTWENTFSKIKVRKSHRCPACNGDYQYLNGEIVTKTIFLCGNAAYQIRGERKDLAALAKKLTKLGEVKRFGNVLYFKEVTLFADGRAIVKAKSEKEAKSLYSRYIGN
jgi:molybdopterin-synthase adenylyltransferase